MAKKSGLTQVAVKIGTAMGKRTAPRIALPRPERPPKTSCADIAEQIDSLKKQLLKTKKRLQKALK